MFVNVSPHLFPLGGIHGVRCDAVISDRERMRGRQQRAGVVGGEGLRRAGTFHCGEVLNIGLRGIDHWVERSSGWICSVW